MSTCWSDARNRDAAVRNRDVVAGTVVAGSTAGAAGCECQDDGRTDRRSAPRGGKIEPHVRADIVLARALALSIQERQIVLGGGVPLLGGEAVPLGGLGVILRHAAAFLRQEPEIEQ